MLFNNNTLVGLQTKSGLSRGKGLYTVRFTSDLMVFYLEVRSVEFNEAYFQVRMFQTATFF